VGFLFVYIYLKERFIIMTKSELKKLIRETLSELESSNPNSQLADPRTIAPSELSRYKAACEALKVKISAGLMGKPIPAGGSVTSVDVELKYKSTPDSTAGGSGFYIQVVARDASGRNMISFGDYL
jgi:hypothetical protein